MILALGMALYAILNVEDKLSNLAALVPIIVALYATNRIDLGHQNQMLRMYAVDPDQVSQTGELKDWRNKYKNALVGAPGGHLLTLKKKTLQEASSDAVSDLDAQFKSRMMTNVGENVSYDRFFHQMPDPTLMEYRGVTFDNDPMQTLPSENLVLERDFMGAVSSNKLKNTTH